MCCDGADCHCEKVWHSTITDHFGSDRWFATTELMLMWRKGDRLPPLVTTGPAIDSDTAGELGEPSTQILFGSASTHDQQTNIFPQELGIRDYPAMHLA